MDSRKTMKLGCDSRCPDLHITGPNYTKMKLSSPVQSKNRVQGPGFPQCHFVVTKETKQNHSIFFHVKCHAISLNKQVLYSIIKGYYCLCNKDSLCLCISTLVTVFKQHDKLLKQQPHQRLKYTMSLRQKYFKYSDGLKGIPTKA